MRFIGRIRLFVSITFVVLMVGCASGPAARSQWRVQRVQPWSANPTKPATPQLMAPQPANPQPAGPRSAAPNAASTRPEIAPPVKEKLVPIPTPDPQARFKPSPLGSSAEHKPVEELKIESRSANKPNGPSLTFPQLNNTDRSTTKPNAEASPPTLRFEALDPPNESLHGSPLKIEVTSKRQRPLGETVTFDVVVTNESEQVLKDVVINVDFDRELVFPGHAEKQLQKYVGEMLPGQSQEMRLTLVSNQLGQHACRFEVTTDGLDSVKRAMHVTYVEPKLRLQLIGPGRRTVGSRAEFTIKIANMSEQAIDDLKVTLNHDAALSPREATGGYQQEATALRWTLGRIAPGEGVQVQAEFDCRQLAENACITAAARSESLSAEEVETCVTVVAVPGLLDLRISDRTDPVRIGEEAEYEVTVQNLGLQAISEVQLDLQTSEHLKLSTFDATLADKSISLTKADRNGQLTLVLPTSLPTDAILRLIIRAKALKPGDAELRVVATPGPSGTAIETSEFTSVNR